MFIADATPDLAAGTAPTTASVAGAMTQPMDSAKAKNQASSQPTEVVVSHSSVRARRVETPTRPTLTTRAAPRRETARLDEPAPITSPSAIGDMIAPASIALYPCANCRYCVRAKIPPSSAKKATLTASVPTLKPALRKKLRSSIGSAVRRSHHRKRERSTAETPNRLRVRPLSQPSLGASITA